jgi:hypothetical protein
LLAGDNVYGSTPALTEAWLMAYAPQGTSRALNAKARRLPHL